MNRWAFWYVPSNSNFTRLVAYIRANSIEAAKTKFFLQYDAQCLELITVERV